MRRLQFKIRWNAHRRFRYLSIRHRVNITIYRTVYLHTDMCLQALTHIQLKNKLWTTVAFLHCCNLIWGLANNNYSLYFSFWPSVTIYVCAIFSFPTVLYSYIDGPLSKLTETSFFCWRSHNYELLQSQHSNISKGKGGTYN